MISARRQVVSSQSVFSTANIGEQLSQEWLVINDIYSQWSLSINQWLTRFRKLSL